MNNRITTDNKRIELGDKRRNKKRSYKTMTGAATASKHREMHMLRSFLKINE